MKQRTFIYRLSAPLLAAAVLLAACGKKAPEGAGAAARPAAPLDASDPLSIELLEQTSAGFAAEIKKNEALIKQGALDDPAAGILAELGPEDAAAPERLLVAGNILFKLSPKDSYRLHMKALEKAPGSKLASIEGAYEQQRAGNYQEACALWDKVLRAEPGRTVAKALYAHCRLEAGDVKGAVAAWSGLGGEDHHNIETAAFEVFGPPHPLARRKELLDEAAGAADADAAVSRLIAHDIDWKVDWWNSGANVPQAEADLARFEGKLTQDAKLPLQLLVRLHKAAEAEGAAIPADDARRLRVLLTKYPDRVRTPVLAKLTDLALERKLFTKAELLAWLRPALEARLASAEGSGEDGLLLAFLADGVDNALMARADETCAERFDNKNCVTHALIARQMSGGLKLEDPFLQKALKSHPHWVFPHMIAMQLAGKDGPEAKDLLRRLILAEFHELEAGSPVHGPHNATGLMFFFKALAESEKS